MQQYLQLLKDIEEHGTVKSAARENMPGTKSLFGYQFRHNLADGFPLLTTKKLSFKNIVIELLWFLRGDTNIKYLVDNGCNIWNEDAYNYYSKTLENQGMYPMRFDDFIDALKSKVTLDQLESVHGGIPKDYVLGDCGFQYGKVWRKWQSWMPIPNVHPLAMGSLWTDQISKLVKGLRENPQSRRHIVTAIDPANDTNLALYWCHSMFQFNCRPLTDKEKNEWVLKAPYNRIFKDDEKGFPQVDKSVVPDYYLDCQLYQRSADVFLGVPYNVASYALLTHIIAQMCNMVPGDFIHTFGDVHIYDNHLDQVNEQLSREPRDLPKLVFNTCSKTDYGTASIDEVLKSIEGFEEKTFTLEGYDPHPSIKAKLSTGLR